MRKTRAAAAASRWEQLKGEVKAQWSRLTDEDIDGVKGNADRLIEVLQTRYRYPRMTAVREVMNWSRSLRAQRG